jgi:hypothetical protein
MRWKVLLIGANLGTFSGARSPHQIHIRSIIRRLLLYRIFKNNGYFKLYFTLGTIQGIYFHKNSEWFQQLVLEHIPLHTFGSWEFN